MDETPGGRAKKVTFIEIIGIDEKGSLIVDSSLTALSHLCLKLSTTFHIYLQCGLSKYSTSYIF